MSLKARSVDNEAVEEAQIPFSLTLLNFLEYLCVSEDEWIKEWTSLNAKNNSNYYFFTKHIEVDRHVVGD